MNRERGARRHLALPLGISLQRQAATSAGQTRPYRAKPRSPSYRKTGPHRNKSRPHLLPSSFPYPERFFAFFRKIPAIVLGRAFAVERRHCKLWKSLPQNECTDASASGRNFWPMVASSFRVAVFPTTPSQFRAAFGKGVEHRRFELLTPTMPLWCSTN